MENPDFFEIQTVTGWRRVLENFLVWCQPQPGWLVLDLGSGPGYLAALLDQQGCRAIAADLNAVSFYPQQLYSPAIVCDGGQLPFPTGIFDLIVASNVVFLSASPQEMLRECCRVLRVGGQLTMLNPSEHMSLQTATDLAKARNLAGSDRRSLLNWAIKAEKFQRWSESELIVLLNEAGLELKSSTLQIGSGLARFTSAVKLALGKNISS